VQIHKFVKLFNNLSTCTLIILAASAVSLAAPAAPAVPAAPDDCWTESQNPRIVDGTFLVLFDTTKVDKGGLLSSLKAFEGSSSLWPVGFPLVDDGVLEFDLKAQESDPSEARADLVARINARVRALQALPGASIYCEETMVAGPAVSGSN
jgi:hypothetical protein